MQSQPGTNPALIPMAELMRFASSELLKIETALVLRPNGNTLESALAFDHWMMVEVNGIEPMTSCLQSRRSPN